MSLKYIFHQEHKSGIITSEQDFFWLESNCKVWITRECLPRIRALSSKTEGTKFKEESELSRMAPRNTIKMAEDLCLRRENVTEERFGYLGAGPHYFDSLWARLANPCSKLSARGDQIVEAVGRDGERKGEHKREMGRKREKKKKKKLPHVQFPLGTYSNFSKCHFYPNSSQNSKIVKFLKFQFDPNFFSCF